MVFDDDIGLDDTITPVHARLRTAEELLREFPGQRSDLVCADCGSRLALKDGKYGIFYGCTKYDETGCKGSHNCNKADARPFGIPGDAATRKARREAHEWLDRLWKDDFVPNRVEAYEWLATALNIKAADCHVGMFDLETCERVMVLVRHRLGEFTRFEHLDREIL